MRLVDGEERDLRPPQLGQEALVVEPLRRDVEQLQLPRPHPRAHVADLVERQRRVEPRGGDAPAGEEVDLVLHQREQRADHDGDALEQQRRKLVAERLAPAGGEHREGRAVAQDGLDRLRLPGPEAVEAEAFLEEGERVGHPKSIGPTGLIRPIGPGDQALRGWRGLRDQVG